MRTFILFLLTLLLFSQCQQDDLSPNVETRNAAGDLVYGSEFTLQLHEQVSLSVDNEPGKTYLTFKSLADSRCPSNANCVSYGNAVAVLSASNSQGKNEHIELCIGTCSPDPFRETHTKKVQVGQTFYNITLKEVQPYPEIGKKEVAKKVKLIVEKLP